MILSGIDYYIFRRWSWLIYVIGIISIIYFEKFDLELIIKIIKQILFVTCIWIFCIFIPRKYFMAQIINFNKKLYDYVPFVLKLRQEILNFPFILEITIFYVFYLNKLLRKLLFLDVRKKNLFLFLRWLIYYNLLTLIVIPLYLIVEFYEIILLIINTNINMKEYIWLRLNFLCLSLIFILLFNVNRIDLIILFWIIDKFIFVYYQWFVNFIKLKKGSILNFDENCVNIKTSYNMTQFNYNNLVNYVNNKISFLRKNTILLFKGLNLDDFTFNLIRDYEKQFLTKWNNEYVKFEHYQVIINDYNDCDNDSQFIVRYISTISSSFDKQIYNDYFLELDVEWLLDSQGIKMYNIKLYKVLLYFLENLKKNQQFIDKFFELRAKYGEFYLYKRIMEENKEIKDFLLKLENLSKEK